MRPRMSWARLSRRLWWASSSASSGVCSGATTTEAVVVVSLLFREASRNSMNAGKRSRYLTSILVGCRQGSVCLWRNTQRPSAWRLQEPRFLEVGICPPNTVVENCLLATCQKLLTFGRSELKLRGETFDGFACRVVVAVGSKTKQRQHQRLIVRNGHTHPGGLLVSNVGAEAGPRRLPLRIASNTALDEAAARRKRRPSQWSGPKGSISPE
jgi:hypothetical protein